jgi:hypothetical protein
VNGSGAYTTPDDQAINPGTPLIVPAGLPRVFTIVCE